MDSDYFHPRKVRRRSSRQRITGGGFITVDFEAVKRIPIPEILARFKIQLRYRGEWASAPCPLPTHKEGGKSRTFPVNLKELLEVLSESCNEKNAINLVAAETQNNMNEKLQMIRQKCIEANPEIQTRTGKVYADPPDKSLAFFAIQ